MFEQIAVGVGPSLKGWDGAALERSAPVGLADAVAALSHALDLLAHVELDAENDRAVMDAALAVHGTIARTSAAGMRLLSEIDARDAYRQDGAVTTTSWFRSRARLDFPEASRLVTTARRLEQFPALRDALAGGQINVAHATAVTHAAKPWCMEAIAACEPALVDLAMTATPADVRTAVRHISALAAPHLDPEPMVEEGPDPRRELHLGRGIDGLWNGHFTLDTLDGELLATLLHAFEQPDAPNTPVAEARIPAQRRADAFAAMLAALAAHGAAPTEQGVKPHILALVDVATLVGADQEATREPRLRYSGPMTPAAARRLARDAKITVIQTMGPWRVGNVGRTHRTLPSWLRGILQMLHGHCRGPDCDRPVAWTEAHHQTEWTQGGETDINQTIPLCKKHHALVTSHGWRVTLDTDTGTCTWTAPDGRIIRTHPPTN